MMVNIHRRDRGVRRGKDVKTNLLISAISASSAVKYINSEHLLWTISSTKKEHF